MRDCIEFTGCRDACGYGMKRHNGKVRRVHVLEWKKHNGPVPSGLVVMHSCDNPSCFNIQHLSVGTRGDNNADRDAKGRQVSVRGEKSPQCKLSGAAIRDIKSAELKRGARAALARKYNVHPTMITRVLEGKRV